MPDNLEPDRHEVLDLRNQFTVVVRTADRTSSSLVDAPHWSKITSAMGSERVEDLLSCQGVVGEPNDRERCPAVDHTEQDGVAGRIATRAAAILLRVRSTTAVWSPRPGARPGQYHRGAS